MYFIGVDHHKQVSVMTVLDKDEQDGRNRFEPIEIEHEPLQRVAFMLLGLDELGWSGLMPPRKIVQNPPEFLSPGLRVQFKLSCC